MLKDTIISVPDYSEGFRKELYEKAMKAKALKNDDNKSISNNNRERVDMERRRFEEVFNHSRLNKLLLDVADKNGNFRTN